MEAVKEMDYFKMVQDEGLEDIVSGLLKMTHEERVILRDWILENLASARDYKTSSISK